MSNHNELIYSVSNHNTFELFNSILNEENEENNKEYCLISNEPLNNSKVTLPCGHSFNYLPLLHDLINYKKIHHNRILYCPYCRINIYGNIPYRYDISNCNAKLKNNCDTYCKRHNKINQFEEQESIKKLNNLENKSVSN
jgi:hypothetical protein